jgi:hypothetical protein
LDLNLLGGGAIHIDLTRIHLEVDGGDFNNAGGLVLQLPGHGHLTLIPNRSTIAGDRCILARIEFQFDPGVGLSVDHIAQENVCTSRQNQDFTIANHLHNAKHFADFGNGGGSHRVGHRVDGGRCRGCQRAGVQSRCARCRVLSEENGLLGVHLPKQLAPGQSQIMCEFTVEQFVG